MSKAAPANNFQNYDDLMSSYHVHSRTQINKSIHIPTLLRNLWSAFMICILYGI